MIRIENKKIKLIALILSEKAEGTKFNNHIYHFTFIVNYKKLDIYLVIW